MTTCPRALSIETLCQWQAGNLPLDVLLEPRLAGLGDPRDRNLAKNMVFGVLRQRGFLDWVLTSLSTTPLSRLKPEVREALRVGAYQLLFCERIPAAAAIHATVEALKRQGQPRWLTGFVNGVLRNVVRRRQEFEAARAAGQMPAEARLNHPVWLLDRWRARYGEQGLHALCRSNQEPAHLCLRVNRSRISLADFTCLLTKQGIPWRQGDYLPEAVWLEDGLGVTEIPGYGEGYFWVQDEIAQLIATLLSPLSAGDCLDACAGLGGKTALLAELLAPGARVTAVEPNPRRQGLFQQNMARLGLDDRVRLFGGSLADYRDSGATKVPAVLVDAPCSGLGVTGRHPDIRWQRTAADLQSYHETQLAILQQAAGLVLPGGVLVYATCSTEPEENEAVVQSFLSNWPHFRLEDVGQQLSAQAKALVDGLGLLRSIPGQGARDGFFAARLRCLSGSDGHGGQRL